MLRLCCNLVKPSPILTKNYFLYTVLDVFGSRWFHIKREISAIIHFDVIWCTVFLYNELTLTFVTMDSVDKDSISTVCTVHYINSGVCFLIVDVCLFIMCLNNRRCVTLLQKIFHLITRCVIAGGVSISLPHGVSLLNCVSSHYSDITIDVSHYHTVSHC